MPFVLAVLLRLSRFGGCMQPLRAAPALGPWSSMLCSISCCFCYSETFTRKAILLRRGLETVGVLMINEQFCCIFEQA